MRFSTEENAEFPPYLIRCERNPVSDRNPEKPGFRNRIRTSFYSISCCVHVPSIRRNRSPEDSLDGTISDGGPIDIILVAVFLF